MLNESGINLLAENDSVFKSQVECFALFDENISSRINSGLSHEKITKKIEQLQDYQSLSCIIKR